ncbi:MAG: FUSC family protein [Solirubrobacteraceae bacterium]
MISTASPPAEPGAPRGHVAFGSALRDATSFDRSAVSVAGGLIATIPLVAVFGLPIAAGDPVAAATMGAGAMLVAIAWRVRGGRPPVGVLSADVLLMGLSTFVGSATGSLPWLHLLVLFAWSLAAGLLVSLGRGPAIVSTQSVIAIVVFGRFAEPASGALGLAGLVLAGGLATAVFVAVVRWPSPLRLQRLETARAYRALSELALAPGEPSTIPAAERLDEARATLASPALFGDAAVLALRALIDEASRARLELRAVQVLLARGKADADLGATRGLLERSAGTLQLIAATVEGEDHAAAELAAAVSKMADRDVGAAGIEPALKRRLDALDGQLRAMARQAPAAALRGGIFERRPRVAAARPREVVRSSLRQLRANATLESPAGRHAVRLAVVVLISEILARHIPLQRSYWLVVAAAAVLRPEFAATFRRGGERILGTCGGVALAGAIVVGLHPSLGVVVPIVGVLGLSAYSVFAASFALGFAFITTLVVFLLDAVTPDTLAIAGDRLLNTLIGGAIGLLAYALWPTWSHKSARQALGDVVSAQRAYLASVLGAIAEGTPAPHYEPSAQARRARIAYMSAGETIARALAEPGRHGDQQLSQSALGATRRIVSVVHVLRTEVQERRGGEPLPELDLLAQELDRTLATIEARLRGGVLTGASGELPELRESYRRLAQGAELERADLLLAQELNELVDAVDSLATLLAED